MFSQEILNNIPKVNLCIYFPSTDGAYGIRNPFIYCYDDVLTHQ